MTFFFFAFFCPTIEGFLMLGYNKPATKSEKTNQIYVRAEFSQRSVESWQVICLWSASLHLLSWCGVWTRVSHYLCGQTKPQEAVIYDHPLSSCMNQQSLASQLGSVWMSCCVKNDCHEQKLWDQFRRSIHSWSLNECMRKISDTMFYDDETGGGLKWRSLWLHMWRGGLYRTSPWLIFQRCRKAVVIYKL